MVADEHDLAVDGDACVEEAHVNNMGVDGGVCVCEF
jgi:hypothetical protein